MDVPTPQIQEIAAVIQVLPQERVSERISPSDSRTNCRNLEHHPTGPEVQTVDIPQRAHREHAPIDVVVKVPVRSCRECHQKTAEHHFVDRQWSRVPRCGLRWSSSQQPSHALSVVWPELAQLVVLRIWKETEAYKNGVHLLPTELDEKVVKLRLPSLGAVLTVFGTKNSSCVELECGTTPPVRSDSARSHLMGSQLG